MPTDREQFVREPPSATEPMTEDEILEVDLWTVEDFFAHFQDGIKMLETNFEASNIDSNDDDEEGEEEDGREGERYSAAFHSV